MGRDRVRLQMVVPNSQKLIMAMDEEHPVLDHLVIVPSMEDKSTALILSDTLQPPHHRFMGLSNSHSYIKCRRQTIFTTAGCFTTYEGHAQASFVRVFIAISNGDVLTSMGFTFGRGILMSTLTTYWASLHGPVGAIAGNNNTFRLVPLNPTDILVILSIDAKPL